MKNLNLYALANELNLGDPKSGTIRVPFGRWDFGAKQLDDGRTVFFVQELTKDGAERMAAKINAGVADGEKGVPVYWGHPDVPELAHKYPDKRAKGWIKSAAVEGDALVLHVEWLVENATDGFGWFSPYWGGPATDLGQGRYLKHLDSLTSVALINIPNIQEFRLANERNEAKMKYELPANILALAARRDALANEANFDESKHPRAEDGKFTSGGGGKSSGGGNDRPDGGFKAEKDRYTIASQAAKTASRISSYSLDRAGRAREINDGLQMFRGRLRGQRHDHWNRLEEYESVRAQHRAAIYLGLNYNPKTHQYE